MPANKFARSSPAGELSVLDDHPPAGEHDLWQASDADAFKHGVVHPHVMRLGADDLLGVGIEDDLLAGRIGPNAQPRSVVFVGDAGDYSSSVASSESRIDEHRKQT